MILNLMRVLIYVTRSSGVSQILGILIPIYIQLLYTFPFVFFCFLMYNQHSWKSKMVCIYATTVMLNTINSQTQHLNQLYISAFCVYLPNYIIKITWCYCRWNEPLILTCNTLNMLKDSIIISCWRLRISSVN